MRANWIVCIAGLGLLLLAETSQAAPIYVSGNTCPPALSGFSRQYKVDQATACMFDAADNNITGTTTEANAFLNAAAAQPTWGTGWVGLGSSDGGLTGFSYTADGGNDDGTFTINPAIFTGYNQFALGIKDGGDPKWAIFLLPVAAVVGNWHFVTEGGDLSHFALYGHPGATIPCDDCEPPPGAVPEPASLVLLGSGLAGIAAAARRRSKKNQ